MVMGHSLDAVLSASARATPALMAYWQFRTFTAPLFLLVSGFAVITSVTQNRLQGVEVFRRYLPRVGLLFFWGFLLRLPVWDLPGLLRLDRTLWQHFFAFDALHVIASSLLLGIGVLAWTSKESHRMWVLALLGAALPLVSESVWMALSGPQASFYLQQVFGGGVSPFSFFPWAGFFFVGAFVGLVMQRLSTLGQKVLFLSVTAVLAMALTGRAPVALMAPTSPLLFSWRLGVPLLILAAAMMVPPSLALRVAPVGRASLWVYVIHLPITYGWAYWRGLDTRIGHTLEPLPALGVALGVACFSVVVALLGQRAKRAWTARKATARRLEEKPLTGLDGASAQTGM